MYSKTNNLLFVHIPKTGGQSMWEYSLLSDKNSKKLYFFTSGNHIPLRYYYNNILGKETIKNTIKFTVVRHPIDKLKSTYFFKKSIKNWGIKDFLPGFYNHLKKVSVKNYWKEYIKKSQFNDNVWYLKQVDFVNPIVHTDVNILRFENLQQDFDAFTQKYNLPKFNLPHVNKSTPDGYTAQHFWFEATKGKPAELVNAVVRHYEDDFKLFDYDMDEWLK
jgi:hypothetical protein